ncbi:hypothetical protein RIB2604_01712880 [Aspergillus luchuensis]|uniref:Uncharacterized protein n=1 Tax=Aspergillus kawachii TaxID=1069201 RepID=A0A146FE08_ASPKA|nr:hypothetical protein RIB2604_01712880 [Aspergillus luchuensis]
MSEASRSRQGIAVSGNRSKSHRGSHTDGGLLRYKQVEHGRGGFAFARVILISIPKKEPESCMSKAIREFVHLATTMTQPDKTST